MVVTRVWVEPTPVDVPAKLKALVGENRLVAETLVRRGITDVEVARTFLNPAIYQPASAFDLPGMERAVEKLNRSIAQHEKILVWGDFDVDGQTATTLLVTALRQLGGNVAYYIPDRITEGHGIHLKKLEVLLQEGFTVILTCDTGIAAHEAVAFAQAQGCDVIVTDHHKLPDKLPAAYVCINPQLLPADHPLHTLPGVGVAYKLIEALKFSDTESLLDLVALGIVADVAILRGDTRYLLQRGLQILRETKRLGLQILSEIAGIELAYLNEDQIGFGIAPRLNALGRLGDAKLAVEFLSTGDAEQARILGYRLEGLNNERKLLSQQVFQAALQQIADNPTLLDYNVLILSHPEWAGGVIGIVANRLVEEYQRPVILINTLPNEIGRGSARSIDGVDITTAIASHSHYLEGYGGHAMAAGLSIRPHNIPAFRRVLSESISSMRGKLMHTPQIRLDGYVKLDQLSLDFVHNMSQLAPFGAGNERLTLGVKNLKLIDYRQLGRTDEHLKLRVEDSQGSTQEIIWWQADVNQLPEGWFDLAFTVSESRYKGKSKALIEFVDSRAIETDESVDHRRRQPELVDYRAINDPESVLKMVLQTEQDIWIWDERGQAKGSRRYEAHSAKTLIIYTIPPSSDVLSKIIRLVQPIKIVLFGVDPVDSDLNQFLQRLAGLVKYTVNTTDGKTSLEHLAGATAQREVTVRKGLEWLVNQDVVRIVKESEGEIIFEKTTQSHLKEDKKKIENQLQLMLEDTAAFRRYYLKADFAGLTQPWKD